MKVFITGTSGFVGSYLLQKLLDKGNQVHALLRNTPIDLQSKNLTIFKGDILDPDSIMRGIQGCDVVYHTAALAKVWTKKREDYYTVNVQGTRNVLEAALCTGVKKVVFTSTSSVLGPSLHQPMTENDPRIISFQIDYERSKYMAEMVCQEYVAKGLQVVIVNSTRIFGSSNNITNGVDKMIEKYMKGKWRFIPGDGNKIGNYAYIEDVIYGHILAMQYGNAGERYILGGENLDYHKLFEKISMVTGASFQLFHIPISIVKLIANLQIVMAHITAKPPVISPSWADRLRYDSAMCCNKAVRELGYHITPFTTALAESLQKKHTPTVWLKIQQKKQLVSISNS